MDMSPDGLKRLIEREGMRLKAYRDTGGVWTICVGHTSAAGPPMVRPGMTATVEECTAILRKDVAKVENCVETIIRVPMAQHEFDAMVSLAYNIGCSAFRRSSVARHLNAGNRARAAGSFLLWNKDNGRVVKGLTNRRRSEMDQFLGKLAA